MRVGPVSPANKSPKFGDGEGLGLPVGETLGEGLAVPVGDTLGEGLAVPVGETLGEGLAVPVGETLGEGLPVPVGETEGEGLPDGDPVGETDGDGVVPPTPKTPATSTVEPFRTCTAAPLLTTGTAWPSCVRSLSREFPKPSTVSWPMTLPSSNAVNTVP